MLLRTRQEGVQRSLTPELQLAAWNRSGVLHSHCDYMVDLRSEPNNTRMRLLDQAFYSYFTEPLSPSLNSSR